MSADDRLRRLLGDPELLALRLRLRKRYERGLQGGVITLGKLSDAERGALCGLLGRRLVPGASMRIDLAEIDAALRHGGLADTLRAALEMLDGAIPDRSAQRLIELQRWENLRAGNLEPGLEPRLAALLADGKGLGLLKRLAGSDVDLAARLCMQAQRVLAQLPAPALARSHLAADMLGDAHALDSGRPVASLVLAALRRRAVELQQPETELQAEGDGEGGESTREIWAAAGVLVNELARPVLFLNLANYLPGSTCGSHPCGAPGEPSYLSLRALLRAPPQWNVAGRPVFVCENPNLVAIVADALGSRSAALVCTDGMPAAAQRTLLMQLGNAGAELHYHGDFDWPGIGIANLVMRQFGAQPWRFGAQDYRTAAATAGAVRRVLGPAAIAALWDPALTAQMRRCDIAIDEEAVAQTLFADLALDS
jgi:uncharacterized protein (TIGR02679 family)